MKKREKIAVRGIDLLRLLSRLKWVYHKGDISLRDFEMVLRKATEFLEELGDPVFRDRKLLDFYLECISDLEARFYERSTTRASCPLDIDDTGFAFALARYIRYCGLDDPKTSPLEEGYDPGDSLEPMKRGLNFSDSIFDSEPFIPENEILDNLKYIVDAVKDARDVFARRPVKVVTEETVGELEWQKKPPEAIS